MLSHFLSDESGAVTVDWTVMTASIVGLGIATYGVVSGGIQNLSGDVDTHLSQDLISTSFFDTISVLAMDFTGGDAGDWQGGTVMAPIAALGEMLVLGPQESTSLSMDIPDGATSATISFDLIGGDSWDDEVATISSDSDVVATAVGNWRAGTMTFTVPDVDGIEVSTTVISSGTDLGGHPYTGFKDTVTRVSITVDNPGDTLDLGVLSGTGSGIYDEFLGIDNVSVTAQ